MNERFRELREQAFDWVQHQLSTVGSDHPVMQAEQLEMINQKFAELIVQECIKEMEEFTIMSEDYVQWNQALSHVALYLKDHFGITP